MMPLLIDAVAEHHMAVIAIIIAFGIRVMCPVSGSMARKAVVKTRTRLIRSETMNFVVYFPGLIFLFLRTSTILCPCEVFSYFAPALMDQRK